MPKGELVIGDSSSDDEEQKQNTPWGGLKKGSGKTKPSKPKVNCIGDSSSDDEAPVKPRSTSKPINPKPSPKKDPIRGKPMPKVAPKPQVEKKVVEPKKNIVKKPTIKAGCIGDTSSDEEVDTKR